MNSGKPLDHMTRVHYAQSCAEAMGYTVYGIDGASMIWRLMNRCDCKKILHLKELGDGGQYCPLHSDEQAMALMKRFNMTAGFEGKNAFANALTKTDRVSGFNRCHDLNRAIVECVHAMQIKKGKA